MVSNKKLTWSERIYLVAIFKGMMVTLKHMFKKKVTISYPKQTIYLTKSGAITKADVTRENFIYGKDKLVMPLEAAIANTNKQNQA